MIYPRYTTISILAVLLLLSGCAQQQDAPTKKVKVPGAKDATPFPPIEDAASAEQVVDDIKTYEVEKLDVDEFDKFMDDFKDLG